MAYKCVGITFDDIKRRFLNELESMKKYGANVRKEFVKGFHKFCITWVSLLQLRKEAFHEVYLLHSTQGIYIYIYK